MRETHDGIPAEVRDEQTDVAGIDKASKLGGEHVHRIDRR